MATIALIWEQGGNLGHIACFAAIAKDLRKSGHEIVLLLQDLTGAHVFFGDIEPTYFQAPLWNKKLSRPATPPITHADLLRLHGFADPKELATLIQAWRNLFNLIRPDIALFNAAPTAMIAARSARFKKLQMDTGFSMPPKTTPMPSLRPWQNIAEAALLKQEQAVLDVINQALGELNEKPYARFADLFDADYDLLVTFPEIDHFQKRVDGKYVGALYSTDKGARVMWPKGKGKCVFTYIQPGSKHFIPLMDALKNTPARIIVSAPGIPPEVMEKYQSPHLVISSKPVHMKNILKEAEFVICHGGQGTTAASLLAGKPILLLPNYLEQTLTAVNVVKRGMGIMPVPGKKAPYARMVQDMLEKNIFQANAKAFAQKYKGFDGDRQVAAIAQMVDAIAVGKKPTVPTL